MGFTGFAGGKHIRLENAKVMSMKGETAKKLQTLKHRTAERDFYALAVSETRLQGTGILDPGDEWKLIDNSCKGKEGAKRCWHPTLPSCSGGMRVSRQSRRSRWDRASNKNHHQSCRKGQGRAHPLRVCTYIQGTRKGRRKVLWRAEQILWNIPDQQVIWIRGDFKSGLGTRDDVEQSPIPGQFGLQGSRHNHMGDHLILLCHAEG